MPSWTGFFNTIILLGVVQGFIVTGLLFFSKKNKRPTRLLAALILLITLASLKLYGEFENWFGSGILRFIADILPLIIVMPIGPLIYFYVQSSLDPSFRLTKKKSRHFYTVLIDLVPTLVILIYIVGVLTKLVRNNPGPWGAFIDDYNVYADIPRWVSISLYLWLSARSLTAYKRRSQGILNGHASYLQWLRLFIRAMAIFQTIWLVYLIPYVIPRYTNMMLDTFDWYPIYIPMAILIYWLGIKGYIISQQHSITDKKLNGNSTALSGELINQVVAGLTKAMVAEKVYRNPNLNLAVMAETTGVSQKIISAVLNQHLQRSFNEFVNGYRVEEFKQKIILPEMNNLTIAGIALECGFNSQATFQRTFKELTGKSPTEFRKNAMPTD